MSKNKLLAFIFSFCSYSYELLLINFAGELSNNNFLVINLTLGFFILGLGLGANDEGKLVYTKEEALNKLLKNEFLLCVTAILSYLFIFTADILQSHSYGMLAVNTYPDALKIAIEQYYLFISLSASGSAFLIGYYTGFELPLLIKYSEASGKSTALMFAYNYLGSLVSAVLLQYFLKYFFGSDYSYFIVILTNILVALLVLPGKKVKKIKFIFLGLICVSFYWLVPGLQQLSLKNFYYKYTINKDYSAHPTIRTIDTPYQKINVIKRNNSDILFLNRQFQFSYKNERLYHEALVHIPISLSGVSPKNILLLGGGDGLALRELLKYKNTKITHIELDSKFLDFCKNDPEISRLNNFSLTDDRVIRITGDAFIEIKKMNYLFDLIIIDFPYPFNYDLWKLYSLEFFHNLYKKLSPDGSMVLDAPVKNKKLQLLLQDSSSSNINGVFYNTLKAAGFNKIKLYSFNKEGFIFTTKSSKELSTNLHSSYLSNSTIQKLNIMVNEKFEFSEKDDSLINSIYKPTLQNFYKDY